MSETPEPTGTLETIHTEEVWTEDGLPTEIAIARDHHGRTWLMRCLDGPVYRWDPDAAKAADLDE